MSANDTITPEELEVEPITNSAAPHPVGTGIGAAGGAMAGAVAGMAGGPLGSTIGAVVGAVAGGALGKATAATISPTEEELYWSENHPSQTYADSEYSYEDYRPAYRLGAERHRSGESFDSVEEDLKENWETYRGSSRLEWEKARDAARASWERVALFPPA